MTYSILIPLRNGNPDDPRGRIPWWAKSASVLPLADIAITAQADGCNEVVLSQPYGTAAGLRVESDQIRRLEYLRQVELQAFCSLARMNKMRTALFTGFGWPNGSAPRRFGFFQLGTLSNDGKWRYPNINSRADARAVNADLWAAKSIGFDGVWIDQLASVDGELGDNQGQRWAAALHPTTGLQIVGEAHWNGDNQTSMVSLGREIDARGTLPRHRKGVRDIVWISGHGTVNGLPDGPPVRTPADQVEAGRRYAALGFEVCYEVDSVHTMRGIVEARTGGGGGSTAIEARVSAP